MSALKMHCLPVLAVTAFRSIASTDEPIKSVIPYSEFEQQLKDEKIDEIPRPSLMSEPQT